MQNAKYAKGLESLTFFVVALINYVILKMAHIFQFFYSKNLIF